MGWEEIKVLGKFPYLGCEGRHRGRGRTWKKKTHKNWALTGRYCSRRPSGNTP